MRPGRKILLAVLAAGLCSIAAAETPDESFMRGNALYRSGNYHEAAQEYETILKGGYTSAELYFNLGNAYYRNGSLAKAILSYERAGLLDPNDPDINHNLRLLYLKTVDRIEPVPEIFLLQWMHAVGAWMLPGTARMLFIAAWILLFCSLTVMYLTPILPLLRIARIAFFAAFILTVLLAGMLGIQSFQDSARTKAIVTAQTVTAKTSPDSRSLDAFVIHEGLKVKLTDAVGEWVKITLPDGKIGWIPASQCERI